MPNAQEAESGEALMTKTMLQHLQDQAADWPEIPEILWAITEISQLRGNLSLAEEGLAAATQEIERLRLLIQTWNDWEETTRMADWFARGQEIERLTKERDFARTVQSAENQRMTIWVEIQVAGGSPIEEVTAKALELANRLQIPVHFKFNGVSCWGEPGDDPARFARQWLAASQAGGKYPSCTSRDMIAYARERDAQRRGDVGE